MKFRALLLPFLFCVLASTTAFSQPVMNWQKNIIHNNTGRQSPKITCVGDIDGDGRIDIVTGDTSSGMSWFKNTGGNGNFASAKFILQAYDMSVIQIADIDGDGFKDIVYVNNSSYWIKNLDGNGNFGAPIALSPTTLQTFGLQVIDMDNDGDMDIVQSRFTSFSSYYIEWLKNNGTGTFAAPIVISSSDSLVRFTVADISGDTLPDMVYEKSSGVFYYQQNANGTFPGTSTEYMGSTSNYMSSAIFNTGNVKGGDIDGDGDTDIVNVYENGAARSIKWFRNDNNVFANSQILVNIPTDSGSSIDYFTFRLNDLDHDGKVDIITQNSATNTIAWYRNLGNGTFGTQQVISSTVLENKDVAIADINADGNPDVVAPDRINNVIKWFDNAAGNATSFIEHAIDDFVNYSFLTAI